MQIIDDVYNYVELLIGHKNFECDKNKAIGYRFYHSRLVANLCIYLLDNISEEDIPEIYHEEMNLKKEIICVAALLHDIKKDKSHHAEEAADNLEGILKEIFNDRCLDDMDFKIVQDMIRNHGGHGYKKEENKYYVMLIQDADNISGYADFIPKEVFCNVFNIEKDKVLFHSSKKKVKEKHKNLNFIFSKKILKV